MISSFVKALSNRFSLKDLRPLQYFLGIQVFRSSGGIFLNQSKYISELLHQFGFQNLKPGPTPTNVSTSLSAFSDESLQHPTEYRRAIGALQYLTQTRPDISFIFNRLSQYFQQPTDQHWQAVKKVFRYLKGTIYHGLHLRPGNNLNITTYCDADGVSNPNNRRSVSSYCVFIGPSLVSWPSKRQSTVSRSSTEAEYRALANDTAEVLWITSLPKELRLQSLSGSLV